MAGMFKVLNIIWVVFSKLDLRIKGASVSTMGVLLRGHAQIFVEYVLQGLLHVLPVGDNAVLDEILQNEDASLVLGLVAQVGFFLTQAQHHAQVP